MVPGISIIYRERYGERERGRERERKIERKTDVRVNLYECYVIMIS